METDKRPSYLWTIVLVANIGTVLVYVTVFLSRTLAYDNHLPLSEMFGRVVNLGLLYTTLISVILSVVPVLISKAKNKWLRRLGYGIPILLIIPVPYYIYDYYTCTGKFCELAPFLLGWSCGLSSIILAFFYTIGNKVSKWSPKIYLSIIWIELLLIIGLIAYIFYPLM